MKMNRKQIILVSSIIATIVALVLIAPVFLNQKLTPSISQNFGDNLKENSGQNQNNQNNNNQPDSKTNPDTPDQKPQSRPIYGEINKEVWIGPTSERKIALTFDAGSGAVQTPEILRILKKNNIKATFFIKGMWAEENPVLLRQIVADGHTLGNHTYSHPYLTQKSDSEILEELERTEQIIKSITGVSTKPYFRAPYGDRNQRVLDVAASAGYQSIYWTCDAWDWKDGITKSEVYNRIFQYDTPGAIYLMHVGDDITPAILNDVIYKMKSDGYELVTLENLFN